MPAAPCSAENWDAITQCVSAWLCVRSVCLCVKCTHTKHHGVRKLASFSLIGLWFGSAKMVHIPTGPVLCVVVIIIPCKRSDCKEATAPTPPPPGSKWPLANHHRAQQNKINVLSRNGRCILGSPSPPPPHRLPKGSPNGPRLLVAHRFYSRHKRRQPKEMQNKRVNSNKRLQLTSAEQVQRIAYDHS